MSREATYPAALRRSRTRPARDEGSGASSHFRPWLKGLTIAAAVILGLFLLVRFIGSPVAKVILNHRLAALPQYSGHVGAVKLAFWRGSVVVDDFVLYPRERAGDAPPLVHVQRVSLALAAKPLFHGKLGGKALVEGAELNAVKDKQFGGPKEAAERAGQQVEEKVPTIKRWQDVLAQSFPLELSYIEIRDSRVHFIDRSHDPVVDVAIDHLHIVATGLRNRREGGRLPASIEASGILTGNGKLHATLQLDPLAKVPTFDLRAEVRELSLPPFNSFMQAYANADVSKGTFESFLEVTARDGGYQGYIKPFFRDLDFKNASDKNKSTIKKLEEKVVSAAASLLKNKEEQKVATKAPFNGTFSDNKVDIWTTVRNLLRNAFVQALREGLEGQTPSR